MKPSDTLFPPSLTLPETVSRDLAARGVTPAAPLRFDADGRLLFTQEMKARYTLLMPQMLPVHFLLFRQCFAMDGYRVEVLETGHPGIAQEGLKYVHNDMCYPALLVIGQLLDALKSGSYDLSKTALLITQTGGGCRASNYIHLLRKALARAGLSFVPVVSLNLSGLEKNPGFSFSLPLVRRMVQSVVYGDLLTLLSNQVKPYEKSPGAADALVRDCAEDIVRSYRRRGGLRKRAVTRRMAAIAKAFAAIPVSEGKPKPRVGIVGEIYVKYAPLGNNGLEAFLLGEGAEPVVPGLLDFVIFKCDNRVSDARLYGTHKMTGFAASLLKRYACAWQKRLIRALRGTRFRAPSTFARLKKLAAPYLGVGNKMGEGWLLTAEMLELVHDGAPNIVCTQPFGCLPNHVAGKGMIRAIRRDHPEANIVAVDYDPGATRVNQENRIKLMLAGARVG